MTLRTALLAAACLLASADLAGAKATYISFGVSGATSTVGYALQPALGVNGA